MSWKKIWQQLDKTPLAQKDHPALKHHGADEGYVTVRLREGDAWFLLHFAPTILYPSSSRYKLIKDGKVVDQYLYHGSGKKDPITWANKIIEEYYGTEESER